MLYIVLSLYISHFTTVHTYVVSKGGGEAIAGLQKVPATQSMREAVRVSSIDNFQGEEAKIIVISTVRNNKCAATATWNNHPSGWNACIWWTSCHLCHLWYCCHVLTRQTLLK
jgi:hypothetical protein